MSTNRVTVRTTALVNVAVEIEVDLGDLDPERMADIDELAFDVEITDARVNRSTGVSSAEIREALGADDGFPKAVAKAIREAHAKGLLSVGR